MRRHRRYCQWEKRFKRLCFSFNISVMISVRCQWATAQPLHTILGKLGVKTRDKSQECHGHVLDDRLHSLSFRSFRSQFYIPVPCNEGLPLPQTLSCPTCNEQNFRLCRIVNPNTSILYQVRRSLRTRHRGGEKLERLLLAMTNPAAFADSAEPAGHVNQSFYKLEANLKFAKNLSFSFLSDIITEKKTTRTKINALDLRLIQKCDH